MIEKILIISFIVMAIWSSLLEGEIFGKIGDWFRKFPDSISKPTVNCPVCMVAWHGSVIYFLIYGAWLHTATWQEWVIVILASMGLNAVFVNIFRE